MDARPPRPVSGSSLGLNTTHEPCGVAVRHAGTALLAPSPIETPRSAGAMRLLDACTHCSVVALRVEYRLGEPRLSLQANYRRGLASDLMRAVPHLGHSRPMGKAAIKRTRTARRAILRHLLLLPPLLGWRIEGLGVPSRWPEMWLCTQKRRSTRLCTGRSRLWGGRKRRRMTRPSLGACYGLTR